MALPLLVIALAVVAVAGATDLLSPGDTVGGSGSRPASETGLDVQETVLATGVSTVGGPWRLTSYESQRTESGPAGEACLRIFLTNPPAENPISSSGFCGKPGKSGLSAVSLPITDGDGHTDLIVFGVAPARAASVELSADAGRTVKAETQLPASDIVPGRFWVMTVPTDLTHGTLDWVDAEGKPAGLEQDAAGFFDRLEAIQQVR